MSPLYPPHSALSQTFGSSTPFSNLRSGQQQRSRTKYEARPELYGARSAVDDAKVKGQQLSDAAVKEFEKASNKAQQAAGKIELYSPKFYAACTFGGLLACVSIQCSMFHT